MAIKKVASLWASKAEHEPEQHITRQRPRRRFAIKRLLLVAPLLLFLIRVQYSHSYTNIYSKLFFFIFRVRVACRKESNKSTPTWSACARELSMIFFSSLFILRRSLYLMNWWKAEMSSLSNVCRLIPGEPLNLKRSATNANRTVLIMRWCWFKETDEWKNAFFVVCSSRSSHMKPEATAFRLRTRKKTRLINHKSHNNA